MAPATHAGAEAGKRRVTLPQLESRNFLAQCDAEIAEQQSASPLLQLEFIEHHKKHSARGSRSKLATTQTGPGNGNKWVARPGVGLGM